MSGGAPGQPNKNSLPNSGQFQPNANNWSAQNAPQQQSSHSQANFSFVNPSTMPNFQNHSNSPMNNNNMYMQQQQMIAYYQYCSQYYNYISANPSAYLKNLQNKTQMAPSPNSSVIAQNFSKLASFEQNKANLTKDTSNSQATPDASMSKTVPASKTYEFLKARNSTSSETQNINQCLKASLFQVNQPTTDLNMNTNDSKLQENKSQKIKLEKNKSNITPKYSKIHNKIDKFSKKNDGALTFISQDQRDLNMDEVKKNQRVKRFSHNKSDFKSHSPKHQINKNQEQPENKNYIVGSSTDIEKSYYRLTGDAPPLPETVRPYEVLLRSVKNVVDKWRENQNYQYCCDQLKAIRQDLVVQNIENGFTLKVYEIHARLAIECGDLTEFNQCLHQLLILSDKYGSKEYKLDTKIEFMAYFLLYSLISHSSLDICQILRSISKLENSEYHPTMRFALKVVQEYSSSNYISIFNMLDSSPQMSFYLLEVLINKIRPNVVESIINVYKPSIKVSKLAKLVGIKKIDECLDFLKKENEKFNKCSTGIIMVQEDEEDFIDTRSSLKPI